MIMSHEDDHHACIYLGFYGCSDATSRQRQPQRTAGPCGWISTEDPCPAENEESLLALFLPWGTDLPSQYGFAEQAEGDQVGDGVIDAAGAEGTELRSRRG